MNLQSHVADPEGRRCLLVAHSANNEGQHLALARGQRREATLQGGHFGVACSSGSVASQGETDCAQQYSGVNGLRQEIDCAFLDHPDGAGNIKVVTDINDWTRARAANPVAESVATRISGLEIQNQASCGVGGPILEERAHVAELAHLQAGRSEQHWDAGAYPRILIDHIDRSVRVAFREFPDSWGTAGIRLLTVLARALVPAEDDCCRASVRVTCPRIRDTWPTASRTGPRCL